MTIVLIAARAAPALVAAGGWAGLLVPVRALKASAEEVSSEARPIPVVVAKHPLYAGIAIRPEDVVVRLVDGQSVPTGPEGQPVVFASVEEVVHLVPRERILQHEPIRVERPVRRARAREPGLREVIDAEDRQHVTARPAALGRAGGFNPPEFAAPPTRAA